MGSGSSSTGPPMSLEARWVSFSRESTGARSAEIGYLIHRPFWRQGIAFEAARAVRDFAFERLALPRIISLIRPENVPSQVGRAQDRDDRLEEGASRQSGPSGILGREPGGPNTMNNVILREVELPDFGGPTVEPTIPPQVYRDRMGRALAAAAKRNLNFLVVYGDREHSANIAYLTGFEPRFEEAMLVLAPGKSPALVVGNEGWGYVDISPVASDLRRVLFQSFSLLAQPRDESPSIRELFRNEGVGRNSRVGVVGWKYFTSRESDAPETCLEIPSYLADALREETGDERFVTNETAIFMNAEDGLRVSNEAEQLAQFECSATPHVDARFETSSSGSGRG